MTSLTGLSDYDGDLGSRLSIARLDQGVRTVRSNRDTGGASRYKSPRDSHVNSDDHSARSVALH